MMVDADFAGDNLTRRSRSEHMISASSDLEDPIIAHIRSEHNAADMCTKIITSKERYLSAINAVPLSRLTTESSGSSVRSQITKLRGLKRLQVLLMPSKQVTSRIRCIQWNKLTIF